MESSKCRARVGLVAGGGSQIVDRNLGAIVLHNVIQIRRAACPA
jgi:hypothetical protein